MSSSTSSTFHRSWNLLTSIPKSLLALIVCMNALPVAAADLLPEINSSVNLDPISLITLFFDSAEKDLIDRTGDMTLLACFGLFVNPSTTWYLYHPPHAVSGLKYYNPREKITSAIEVQQVNSYLVSLASTLKNRGVVLWVKPLQHKLWWPTTFSWEWMVVRPFALIVLVCIAGLSRDMKALGAIGTLLLGQSIAIFRTVRDGKIRDQGPKSDEQTNIFFMPNNVTFVVKCHGLVFVRAMSIARASHPALLRTITTLIFMGGILLVGLTEINFKIAFLVMHAFQAALLSLGGWKPGKGHVINGALWQMNLDVNEPLTRRRDAYVWTTKLAGVGTQWLTDWDLAAGETLAYVERELSNPGNLQIEEGVKDSLTNDANGHNRSRITVTLTPFDFPPGSRFPKNTVPSSNPP